MKIIIPRKINAIVLAVCAAFVLTACPSPNSGNAATDAAPAQDTEAQAPRTQDLPIAVQMWTVRSLPTLEDQLKAVQAAGVSAVEIVNTHNVSAEELKGLLNQYSLQIAAMHLHTPLSELNTNLDTLVATCKTLGIDKMVMPWIPPDQRPTNAAGWVAIGETLGEAARRAEAQGITLAYHNHDFEIVDFDGKTALELLFEAAGPALKAELDVAWIAVAGRDPAEFLNKFSGRVFAIHAKDKAKDGHPEAEQGLADVGAGVIDWTALLTAAHAAGVQWYIIEHDAPTDPAVSIKNSAVFLTERLPAVGVSSR